MTPDPELSLGLDTDLRSAFMDLMESYGPEGFLIIENAQQQFVQFADAADGFITLDLPTQTLTPEQERAAEAVIVGELGGAVHDIGAGHRAFTLKTPTSELYLLVVLTAKVFLAVYGAPLTEPVRFTLGASPPPP
jgi:hypothetical protein